MLTIVDIFTHSIITYDDEVAILTMTLKKKKSWPPGRHHKHQIQFNEQMNGFLGLWHKSCLNCLCGSRQVHNSLETRGQSNQSECD